ncbi:hypothetical protein [Burkholderia sp. LMG 21824]|uniref:hypothetical protein n=1 Tax=Burkholderia sp. LMG 21824 TaxID=3158172 RepID=UPI003C2FA1C5
MVFIFIVSSLRLKKRGMGLPRTFTGAAMRRRYQSVDWVHRRGHAQCLPVPLSLCPEPIFRVVWLGDGRPAGGEARVAHAGHYERVMWKFDGNGMEIPRNRDERRHCFARPAAHRGRGGRTRLIEVRASTGTR